MVKISEIKDGYCCEFHRDTYLMFYQGSKTSVIQKQLSWVVVENANDHKSGDRTSCASIGKNPSKIPQHS